MRKFHDKLRDMIGDHRYSQDEAAKGIGVSQNTVSAWTRGKSVPDIRQVRAIAAFFEVPVLYLIDEAIEHPEDALPRAAGEVSKEERYVLDFFRESGLDWALAVTAIGEEMKRQRGVKVLKAEVVEGPADEGGGNPSKKKGRLGFESEEEVPVGQVQAVPPVRARHASRAREDR
jgi:transcriptional regulator with XRE-family HTH domain